MHILCTICSDIVNHAESIFVTKCGHLFHHHCLTQWIERSKTCPQCRNKVTDRCMFRVWVTAPETNGGDEDAPALRSRLDDAALQLRSLRAKQQEADDKMKDTLALLHKTEKMLKESEKKLLSRESSLAALREQLEYVKVENREVAALRLENDTLKKTLQTLKALQAVLGASAAEAEEMVRGYSDVRTLATFTTALKRALCESESKKKESRDRLQMARTQLAAERARATQLEGQIKQLQEQVSQAAMEAEAAAAAAARPAKRKTLDEDTSVIEDSVCKLPRAATPAQSAPAASPNDSLGTMVARISAAQSPYLALARSNVALAQLQRRRPRPNTHTHTTQDGASAGGAEGGAGALSIFRKKEDAALECFDTAAPELEISFDGLGGHSKVDRFPVPAPRPLKSLVPKLSSRHRLKRPPAAPAGCRSIADMLNRSQ